MIRTNFGLSQTMTIHSGIKIVYFLCLGTWFSNVGQKWGNFFSSVFCSKYVYPFYTCRKSANNKVCGVKNVKKWEKFVYSKKFSQLERLKNDLIESFVWRIFNFNSVKRYKHLEPLLIPAPTQCLSLLIAVTLFCFVNGSTNIPLGKLIWAFIVRW